MMLVGRPPPCDHARLMQVLTASAAFAYQSAAWMAAGMTSRARRLCES